MKFYHLLFALVLMNWGCNSGKEDPEFDKIQIDKSKDFLVFGSVYGECTGDCRDLFLLMDGFLYADANSNTDLQLTVFNENPLPLDKYYLATQLESIPSFISDNEFAMTDFVQYIADFDFYVYGQREGNEFELVFDAIENQSPQELKDYALKLQEVLDEL